MSQSARFYISNISINGKKSTVSISVPPAGPTAFYGYLEKPIHTKVDKNVRLQIWFQFAKGGVKTQALHF